MDRRNSIFLSDAQEKLLLFFIIHYYLFTESVYRVPMRNYKEIINNEMNNCLSCNKVEFKP